MVQAYRAWSTIEHPEAWARRVASRMWARRLAGTLEEPVSQLPDRPGLLAITDVVAWEQRHDVLRILDQLPARQRQVLAWRLDGYRPAEIAAELRMTAEAVRSNLLKARRAVAEQLRDGGRRP
jgi:RNA polymerase sigma-70 factor (ECF subfamily)